MDKVNLMAGRAFRRIGGLPAAVLATALIGIMLCVAAITFLAENVGREVEALAVASSDNTQWSLGQTEVELLLLHKAIREALSKQSVPDQLAKLNETRLRFDVFYSRIHLINQSQQFASVRQDAQSADSLEKLNAFLDTHTSAFDGPNSVLFGHLPQVAADLEKLMEPVREIALLGVLLRVEDSDGRREGVATTLTEIGYLTLILVLALLAGVAILVAMFLRIFRSERATEDARNRLQTVIATSLDGIIAADTSGKVLEYNGAAELLFGYSRQEALGRDLAELIVPEQLREAHAAGMKRYRMSKNAKVVGAGLVRLEALRKDGTTFPVELSLSAAQFNGEDVIVSFVRDISDRIAAEQDLIEARDRALAGRQAKADLLAVMSHEMRTPLNGIIGAIELIEETRLSSRQNGFVSAIKTSAGLLLHHVNGVLSMSRAEAGQLELQAAEVDPSALVQEMVESQRHAVVTSGNQISFDTKAAPGRIWIDPFRLRQVILNLIGNANKFTRNGEILVECDTIAATNEVEFRVIDTGIGIAESDQERIFEEFRTLDASYSRRSEGTGLGLAISHQLVKAMGGEIGVDSELGEGSLFWVRLPIGNPVSSVGKAEAANALTTKVTDGVGAARPLRVLLVEDNKINRLIAREMLIKYGHKVLEAHDGQEGVRLAEIQPFDVILMDISMPGLDGVTASILIREGNGPNRRVPIFALTAHALSEDAERFQEAGISKTLIKPISMATLRDALSGVEEHDMAADAHGPEPLHAFDTLLADLGRTTALALLDSFLKEGDDLVKRVKSASWAEESDTARADAVHKAAGSASVFGAEQFRKHLHILERYYRAGQSEPALRHLDLLATAWTKFRAEISVHLQSQDVTTSEK